MKRECSRCCQEIDLNLPWTFRQLGQELVCPACWEANRPTFAPVDFDRQADTREVEGLDESIARQQARVRQMESMD